MHSAIVVVNVPEDSHQGRQGWAAFSATIEPISKDPAAKRLDQLVWLIDFQKSPGAFAQLVDGCVRHRVTYGILPLADAPQWLPVGFDPKTNANSWGPRGG
jgi:hypothetical protein